jgi:hypothetical protein
MTSIISLLRRDLIALAATSFPYQQSPLEVPKSEHIIVLTRSRDKMRMCSIFRYIALV